MQTSPLRRSVDRKRAGNESLLGRRARQGLGQGIAAWHVTVITALAVALLLPLAHAWPPAYILNNTKGWDPNFQALKDIWNAPAVCLALVLVVSTAAAVCWGRMIKGEKAAIGEKARAEYAAGRHYAIIASHDKLGDAYTQERDDGERVLQVRDPVTAFNILSSRKGFGKLGEWAAVDGDGPSVDPVSNLVQPIYHNTFLEMPDGDAWAIRRRAAAPAFAVTQQRAAAFAADTEAAADALLPEGQASADVELQHFCHRLLRIHTQRAACGSSAPLSEEDQCTYDKVTDYFVQRYYDEPSAKSGSGAAHGVIDADVDALAPALEVAKKHVASVLAAPEKGTLLAGLHATGQVNAQELAETLVDIIIAGAESPAGSCAWMLAELAKNPSAQQRCREEAAAALEAAGGVEAEALKRMPFVEACAKEAMRIHTPATLVHRTVAEDGVVAGMPVKKGSKVGVCLHAVHMHEGAWEEPERFNPDRFLNLAEPSKCPFKGSGVADVSKAKLAFMPFTAGPRGCPGGALTLAWAKLCCAAVLRRFDIEEYLPPPGGPKAVAKWVGWERDGITVRLRAR